MAPTVSLGEFFDRRVAGAKEIFNLTNTQRFNIISSMGVQQDPYLANAGADFGRYFDSQKCTGETRPGRVMQFAWRYIL